MKPLLLGMACLTLCLGCKRAPEQQRTPPRTEPWRATPSAAAAAPARIVQYALTSPSQLTVSLRGKREPFRGSLTVLRGRLAVDLANLEHSRGNLQMDLGSLQMEDTADAGSLSRSTTARARAWLNLGSKLPEAERERLRWAEFTLKRIVSASATRPELGSPGASEGDAGSSVETRRVRLEMVGDLQLNDRRVEHRVAVEARFSYATAAEATAVPAELRVELLEPGEVILSEHDVKPRDEHGTFLAEQARSVADYVGRKAMVSGILTFRPAAAGQAPEAIP